MYCFYTCCFPCLVSLTESETCLSQRVLKGEQLLAVITDGFFSFYASFEKMRCVSHNSCDCVTLLFHILQSYWCTSKNTDWSLACHWRYDQLHCMCSCFQGKLVKFGIWMWRNVKPDMVHQQASLNAWFLLNEKGYCLRLFSTSDYSEKIILHIKVCFKRKSQTLILA